MTKKQWIIIVFLAVGDLIVLCGLGLIVLSGTLGRGSLPAASAPSPAPTVSPTSLLPPTWTPSPVPSPTPSPVPTPRALSPADEAALRGMEGEVAALRGLTPLQSVPHQWLTRREMQDQFSAAYLGEEQRQSARDLALTLAAFDMMPPYVDLLALLRNLTAEQVAGFYDPQGKTIYLVSDTGSLGVLERVVFVHEYTHALQDQVYGLQSLGLTDTDQPAGYGYNDRALAVRALVEGDAQWLQEQYVTAYFTSEQMEEFLAAANRTSTAVLDFAPAVVRETFLFPYFAGRAFVAALYADGEWEAVDLAYTNPPSSTEQILHPDRYLAGDPPLSVSLPPLADTLGSGWRLLYDGPFGEFLLRQYLGVHLDAESAADAAEGWGGDRSQVYYDDAARRTVLLLRLAWDTPEDAAEFLLAYDMWAEERFGHPADTTRDGLSCWQGRDVLCLAWDDQATTVVLGPDRSLVDRLLAALAGGS